MKHLRKVMTLVIAAIMALAVSVPAFAASITINAGDDVPGTVTTSYTYYQLLHASYAENDNTKVVYYLNDGDDDALRTLLDAVSVNGTDLFTFTKSGDGTRWNVAINDAFGDSDGEAISNALNTDAIKAAALATDTFTSSNKTATATGLEDGYYLVTSTLGSKLVLDTIGAVEINTKNEYITNEKKASKTNMEVGDHVEYTITINIPATAAVGDTVTVHDTLDEHLAILDASEEIAASAADYAISAVVGEDGATVALSDATLGEGETFAKQFDITQDIITAGKVTIKYTAELLSTAADDTGYVNTEVTNTSAYETVPTEVKVYTFDFDLDKTFTGVAADEADDFEATFELRTDAEDAETAIAFITDATGYVKADSNDSGASTELTVTGGDPINVRGLAAGVYYLVETSTAEGFNLLTAPITVTITDTTTGTQPNITPGHTVTYTDGTNSGNGTVNVTNNSGSELPSTGGMGTRILYTVGGIMLVGGAIALVSKKRAASLEK